jgi:hypothetical protein
VALKNGMANCYGMVAQYGEVAIVKWLKWLCKVVRQSAMAWWHSMVKWQKRWWLSGMAKCHDKVLQHEEVAKSLIG